jgi:DNA ligase-1
LDELFNATRKRGHEGLMVKDPASPYAPGRRGGAWVKLKKRLATLDAVVTAAEYGHGKRRGVLSDYTFALRNSEGTLATLGKAYSGLTDAEIAELTDELLASVISKKGNRLEVEPKIVLEIAFDAIRESPRHASGLALRFPRIVRIRRDKALADIDTVETARRLRL